MFNFQRGNSAPWAGLLDGSELSNGQLISPKSLIPRTSYQACPLQPPDHPGPGAFPAV